MRRSLSSFNIVSIALGLAFLYLPIVILVIYSFNASRLVTVWGGWSTRWYRDLLNDQAMLEAAWVSLRIAFLSASAATILGTMAAFALVRIGGLRGRPGARLSRPVAARTLAVPGIVRRMQSLGWPGWALIAGFIMFVLVVNWAIALL